MRLGLIVQQLNGCEVREVFVEGDDGREMLAGYAVLDRDGNILAVYPEAAEATEHLQEIARLEPPSSGMRP